jgi:hypothetical protein
MTEACSHRLSFVADPFYTGDRSRSTKSRTPPGRTQKAFRRRPVDDETRKGCPSSPRSCCFVAGPSYHGRSLKVHKSRTPPGKRRGVQATTTDYRTGGENVRRRSLLPHPSSSNYKKPNAPITRGVQATTADEERHAATILVRRPVPSTIPFGGRQPPHLRPGVFCPDKSRKPRSLGAFGGHGLRWSLPRGRSREIHSVLTDIRPRPMYSTPPSQGCPEKSVVFLSRPHVGRENAPKKALLVPRQYAAGR